MGFIKAGTIVTDRVQVIPDASLYDFGIIISNIHMAWMRVTCMRLKSDYSYSKDIVYNNFPWPSPTEQQRQKIEKTAQGILDARALYLNSSLATLYDELTMPPLSYKYLVERENFANPIITQCTWAFTLASLSHTNVLYAKLIISSCIKSQNLDTDEWR